MPSYDTRPRFIVKFRCRACGNRFKRTLRDGDPDPNCPQCAKSPVTTRGIDFNAPPPARGGSIGTRAMDATMEMVAKDYGMTNLRDDMRVGETLAPRLRPDLQDQADNFFAKGSAMAKKNPAAAAQIAKMQSIASSGVLASQPDTKFINNVIDRSSDFKFRRVGGGKLH